MKRVPDKYTATHILDDGCTVMVKNLTVLLPAAGALECMDEINAIFEAVKALHQRVAEEHKRCMN